MSERTEHEGSRHPNRTASRTASSRPSQGISPPQGGCAPVWEIHVGPVPERRARRIGSRTKRLLPMPAQAFKARNNHGTVLLYVITHPNPQAHIFAACP